MTRNIEISAVNCKSCGAGLDVLGGGRVVVHICPYCGSELDATENYRVLRKLEGQSRPNTPFSIGMSGQIYGIDFTVIGILAHEERWRGRTWSWVDHQLYSPTHGYAFLSIEDNHFTFSRRIRDSAWISEGWVKTANYPPEVSLGDERFRYYETSTSKITYAEGEFTWSPKIGEASTTISAMSETAMLGFTRTNDERELEKTIYLDHAIVAQAFGIVLSRSPYRTHPLQPFRAGRNHKFITAWGAVCVAMCLVLMIIIGANQGTLTHASHYRIADFPVEIPFDVEKPVGLTKIAFEGNGLNHWSYWDIEVTDPEDTPVFETGRTVEKYAGRTSEGNWTENNNKASLAFKPNVSGTYTLSIEAPEMGTWGSVAQGARHPKDLTTLVVKVTNGHGSVFWLTCLMFIFAMVMLFPLLRQYMHHKLRWAGSDWTDED